ncbi:MULTISPECIES: hypothetical protein [Nocardioides]|uniref:hypothetical protein n=1 Tax=Nocardioides TaxID=1839 RepID=UPI0028683547|nr:hypothetical protein [Nocardioides sp. CGMCC 1.13656]
MENVQGGLREALKLVAVALKDGDAPFALTGGYALWARGAPEPVHDVDFMVAEEDAARTAELLADQGLEVVQPPEDWLFKVYVDGAMVDILFRAGGDPVTRERLHDVDQIEVESVRMPVLSATELLVDKLNALEEHACDLGSIVPAARAVREQVDWAAVAEGTAGNDFAAAALFLLDRLGVASGAAPD